MLHIHSSLNSHISSPKYENKYLMSATTSVKLNIKKTQLNDTTVQTIVKILEEIGFVAYLHKYQKENIPEIVHTTQHVIYYNNKQIIIKMCLWVWNNCIYAEFVNIQSKYEFHMLYSIIVNKLFENNLTNKSVNIHPLYTITEKIDEKECMATYRNLCDMILSDDYRNVNESLVVLYNLVCQNNNMHVLNKIDPLFLKNITNYLFKYNDQVDYIIYNFCILANTLYKYDISYVKDIIKKNIEKTTEYDSVITQLVFKIFLA